jgi:hypothetical protein
MSEIIIFPKSNLHSGDWEAATRFALKENGLPPSAIDWIVSDLRPRWSELCEQSGDLELPEQPAPYQERLEDFFANSRQQILVQLIRLEIELWQALFGDPLTPNEHPVARSA